MSITLPLIDMTGQVTGGSGQIPVKTDATNWNIAGSQGEPAHLRVLNESGCGLKIWTDTNQINEYKGAGAWFDLEIEQGTNYLNWQVQYSMPNPPANIIMVTFYSPGEKVPAMGTLGNSPIGGSSSTTAVGNSLSNEANATPALIIDIGQVANTNLINVFSDGSFAWNIVVGGVVHTLMKGSTASLLQLSKLGDIAEFLGNVLVDGTLTINGITHGLQSGNFDGNSIIAGSHFTGGGNAAFAGQVSITGAGTALSITAGSLTVSNGNSINSDSYNLTGSTSNYGGQNSVGSFSRITTGTVAIGASSTASPAHGLGTTPSMCWICCEDGASTSTGAIRAVTSTTLTIFSFSACTWRWIAWRM